MIYGFFLIFLSLFAIIDYRIQTGLIAFNNTYWIYQLVLLSTGIKNSGSF
jgi:hypothetical protein